MTMRSPRSAGMGSDKTRDLPRGVAFFAVAFFAVAFFAVAFFAVAFFAVALFAVAFLAVAFFVVGFFAVAFFAGTIYLPLMTSALPSHYTRQGLIGARVSTDGRLAST